jgi:organic hydroperoxide reductase OsmC/OhrA
MALNQSTLVRERGEQPFVDGLYSRKFMLHFDGCIELQDSPSLHIVRPPLPDPAAVDPEEMFVASLSVCHMLWFLSIAAKRGYCIDRYCGEAAGLLRKDAEGRLAMTQVTLRPKADFSGEFRPPNRRD